MCLRVPVRIGNLLGIGSSHHKKPKFAGERVPERTRPGAMVFPDDRT